MTTMPPPLQITADQIDADQTDADQTDANQTDANQIGTGTNKVIPQVYRASTQQNLITIALGWWLCGGLFIDGWAHNQFGDNLETFFTPWHAVFYSGFLAVASWCFFLASKGWKMGLKGLNAFPQGYQLAAFGVPIFAIGGMGDMIWHSILGIEVGIEALLSPTHLLLFLGGVLILASPLNAAWLSPTSRSAALGMRWTAVLSAASLLAITAFMHMYMWGLISVPQGTEYWKTRGEMSGVLLTALILAAPILLLIRRFNLPFGAVTLMYGITNLGIAAMITPGDFRGVMVGFGCGLLVDLLYAALQPSPKRIAALRAFAFLLPLCVWIPFLGGAVRLGLSSISLELWVGVSVMAGLGGLALSVLVFPAPLPPQALED